MNCDCFSFVGLRPSRVTEIFMLVCVCVSLNPLFSMRVWCLKQECVENFVTLILLKHSSTSNKTSNFLYISVFMNSQVAKFYTHYG